MTSTPKKDYVALGKKAAEMAEFVKAKTAFVSRTRTPGDGSRQRFLESLACSVRKRL